MHQNAHLIRQFYTAFQNQNYAEMQRAYHVDASFHDPVFLDLNSREVKAMWQMLVVRAKDLTLTFSDVKADQNTGSCHWEAWYTFTKTGRKVHNIIDATFEFKDGRIFSHRDTFDLWRWSRQAIGPAGWVMGWSSVLQNSIRKSARQSLDAFMKQSGL